MNLKVEARVFDTRYTRCSLPLDDGGLNKIHTSDFTFSDGVMPGTWVIYNAKMLKEYRAGIGKGTTEALNPEYNYIYRIDKPLRIFEDTLADRLFALKRGMVDEDALKRDFPDKNSEAALASIDQGDKPIQRYLKLKPFVAYFDGLQLEKVDTGWHWSVGVWLDIIKDTTKLVDDNVLRFVKEAPGKIPEIPEDVLTDLVSYTSKAGGTLGTTARKWFQTNIKPPYGSIKVYRGVKISAGVLENLNKEAQKFLGLPSILDAHKGANVVLSRGKASSWSTTPQISREFANSGDFQFMIQADLKPKQIIVDLTLLPIKVRQKLAQFSQNEVIAAPGKIPGKIIWVGISKWTLDKMTKSTDPRWNDLTWVPRWGLVQKAKAVAARIVTRFQQSLRK